MLDDLRSNPLRPLGLTEVAALTDPWITRASWSQWLRRGLLPAPRWTVNGSPAWAALDVLSMLRSMQLHFDGDARRAIRCGPTCPACTAGDTPVTWVERWEPATA